MSDDGVSSLADAVAVFVCCNCSFAAYTRRPPHPVHSSSSDTLCVPHTEVKEMLTGCLLLVCCAGMCCVHAWRLQELIAKAKDLHPKVCVCCCLSSCFTCSSNSSHIRVLAIPYSTCLVTEHVHCAHSTTSRPPGCCSPLLDTRLMSCLCVSRCVSVCVCCLPRPPAASTLPSFCSCPWACLYSLRWVQLGA